MHEQHIDGCIGAHLRLEAPVVASCAAEASLDLVCHIDAPGILHHLQQPSNKGFGYGTLFQSTLSPWTSEINHGALANAHSIWTI